MGRLVIVKGDPVEGTDKHNVSGLGPHKTSPPPATAPYKGVGDFSYAGTIADRVSDFVRIGGRPIAVVTSRSALDSGQDKAPLGKHSGPAGSSFVAGADSEAPTPIPPSLEIKDDIGPGVPSAGAGSRLLTVGKAGVLLDADKIDTCSGAEQTKQSTVTAAKQSFVTCSE